MNTPALDFKSIRAVYFLGIGGIGMSALARFFHAQGKKVGGYDKTPTTLTDELQREGIDVHFQDDVGMIDPDFLDKDSSLIVLTPAVPADHAERNHFLNHGFRLLKRSEVLGVIASNFYTVAVAGTHGKTTTSTLIAHLLRSAGVDCTAFLGGIAKNYNSNLLIGSEQKGRHIVVVEADEYDRSFLTLFPDIAVITSMDPDHLDIYGSEEEMRRTYQRFASQVKSSGQLIVKHGLPVGEVVTAATDYSLYGPAEQFASRIEVKEHAYHFDWTNGRETFIDLWTQLPGSHNVENAVAAITVARTLGLEEAQIRKGLETYTGVKRRFDYQIKLDRFVYIDDYAHHPAELRACISSAKELYPGKSVTGIFQPHLFTRTRDFAKGFAESLSLLDRLILLDIYPARELPIPGVTSEMILEKVTCPSKVLLPKEQVLDYLSQTPLEVLLTLGAGDIDQLVDPIRRTFSTHSS